MKKIIIDSNIIFSALLNLNSNIGSIIFNLNDEYELYSCEFMELEIIKHWQKIIKISKQSDEALRISYSKISSRINFINEDFIPKEIWVQSKKLVENIDLNDIDFVAMTLHLNGVLWTGDKKLYEGLLKNNFSVFNTQDLIKVIS